MEREWHQQPGWFATLTPEQRAALLADVNVRTKPAPKKQTKQPPPKPPRGKKVRDEGASR